VGAALLDDDAPNALAVGLRRSSTTLVVTTGLVEKLTRDELEAVLATQLCAVRRLDTALRTIAVAATSHSGSVYRLFQEGLERGQPWYSRLDWSAWALAAVTWPTMVAGRAVRRSVLRSFDFGADDMAVAITRHPEALVSALRKLRDDPTVVDGLTFRNAPLWFEPIPNDEKIPGFEWGRYAYAPTLDERLDRLATLTQPT
jgi:heat shock protein HtpX